jgi:hypothetical protein
MLEAEASTLLEISRLSRESASLIVFPILAGRPAGTLAYLGVSEGLSSLLKLMEGLVYIADRSSQHKRT